MTDDINHILINSLEDLIEKVLEDKTRLKHAINSITEDNSKNNINDKLINNLDNLEFEDNNMQNAIEYLTLILSNMETQKITTTKIQDGEMIKILDHILLSVKHVESIIKTFNIETEKTTDADTASSKSFIKDTLLPNIVPSGAVSNSIMWILILILVLSTIHEVDNSALVATDKTVSTVAKNLNIHTGKGER